MAVTQYIGARYVPIFADPIEWSNTKSYEPLTIVTYQGASYTSKQAVPVGIDISNGDFWVLTGNYNAQVEQYRQEVRAYDARITQAQSDASDAKDDAESAIDSVSDIQAILAGYAEGDTVKGDVSALQTAIGNVDAKIGTLPEGETDVVSYVSGEVQVINTDLDGIDARIDGINDTLVGFDAQNTVKDYVDSKFSGKKDMVVVGDSFTSDYYVTDAELWYHPVADFLDCNGHNYSERGAGFTRAGHGGNTFRALAEQAAADTAFDNANVAWVFVYGGLNDIDHANADVAFSTDFNTFCSYVASTFPNARLVVCGINAWQSGFSFYQTGNNFRGQIWYEQIMQRQSGFLSAHGIFVSMCGALGFNDAWYDSNNNHPNAAGQSALASWILSAMFGTGFCRSVAAKFKYDGETETSGTMTLHLTPGAIEFDGQTPAGANDKYILDTLGFFKDQAINLTGLVLTGGSNVGWLRTRNANGYVGVNQNGYFHGSREF